MTQYDVIIAGAGFAGLVAARAAAESGAHTLVLEAAERPGGSAAISAGAIWAPETTEKLTAYVPDGDAALQRAFCENFEEALSWLSRTGLPLSGYDTVGGVGRGRAMDIGAAGDRHEFMALMAQQVHEAGATILYGTPLVSAAHTHTGAGIEVQFGGAPRKAHTRALIVATGGFQSNPELRDRYIGQGAGETLVVRSAPRMDGVGLTAALSLGADVSRNMDCFYGHTMPDVEVAPAEMQPLTPYFARQCVFLNRDGLRFIDESAGLLEELNPQLGWRQPGGVYWLVFDARIYREHGINQRVTASVPTQDRLARWREIGAPIIETPTLEALVQELSAREGVDAAAAVHSLGAYNASCESGDFSPGRIRDRLPLAEAPFYAVRARAGITCTCGGVRIDASGRALDSDGDPVPGLYAAGVDAGGVFGRTYGGFLGWALVSGYLAGRAAVAGNGVRAMAAVEV